jgi:hypothetical protein
VKDIFKIFGGCLARRRGRLVRESVATRTEIVTIIVTMIEWVMTKQLILAAAITVAADLTGSVSSLFMPGVPSHGDEVVDL